MSWEIRQGDCLEVMAAMPECSVDAVVCDPPYSLGFMGRAWDSHESVNAFQDWCRLWGAEALRVLKPGGHLLAFGGTRTYHRLACAIEDAGFEVRDTICWLYGSGFPKSLDVGKAIDKAAGAEREVLMRGAPVKRMIPGADQDRTGSWIKDNGREFVPTDTAPATHEAEQWDGWGTALKPAHEPIVVARKPLAGTVAQNSIEHGTGALNIDGCRVESGEDYHALEVTQGGNHRHDVGLTEKTRHVDFRPGSGRWPANVVLDEEAAGMLDEQGGELASGLVKAGSQREGLGYGGADGNTLSADTYGDSGGASRFFYCAKSSRAERGHGNTHPTVKPVALMCWLVRLVTPPGGIVLDPFVGSGTTGIAALREGFGFIGIERDPDYCVARQRIRDDAPLMNTTSEVAA